MYFGKRVSVVIATFNGEKYIQEQLDSILTQTVLPDEIVVSDDGSSDRTIEIVNAISSKSSSQIKWILLEDNPRHGYTGNFEYALSHSSGDYSFFCDQDDVWDAKKIEHVIHAFLNHPDAWLICHDAVMVDMDLKPINEMFTPNFPREEIADKDSNLFRFDRSNFLAKSITETFPGMVMCISKKCAEAILPFPRMNGHDTWAFFCAICENQAYYLPEKLTSYRIHGANVSSPVENRRSFFHRLKKYKKMLSKADLYSTPLYEQSYSMLQRMKQYGIDDSNKAYLKANDLYVMANQLREAETSGRIKGCFLLLKLHASNSSYHAAGTRQVAAHMLNIMLHSKARRLSLL